MIAPTVNEIREWSQMDFASYGYGSSADLQVLLDRAIEYVQEVTGRKLATLPDQYEKTMQEALQRTVEQSVLRSQEDALEVAADFETISNMSVTGYSENRRNMDDLRKAQMINPWPLLHDLLWRMATDDRRDEWDDYWAGGSERPAFDVSEMDWDDSALPPSYLSPGA
jgi:hypothetical protein